MAEPNQIQNGYLVFADISGYTAYLTEAEQQHAGPILAALLTCIVENFPAPMVVANLEGDGVLVTAPPDGPFSGQTFLEVIESIYFAFTDLRRQMVANTTCDCRACTNIEGLDLKFVIHRGDYEVLDIAGRKDLSGPDVILTHRLAKSHVRERTNISSYALFSRPAADGLSVGNFATLVPYGESFEHFGRVDAQVHDLRQAWERNWQQREATVVKPEGAAGHWQVRVPLSMPQAWDYITLPKLKKDWMQMLDVTREDDLGGRFGVGTAIHCAHKTADFRYRFIDWRPFQYFSCLERDPFSPLNFYSTWSLTPDGDGTIVGYAMAQPFLPEDAEQRDMSEETENLLNIMSAVMPAIFENLRRMVETKGAA